MDEINNSLELIRNYAEKLINQDLPLWRILCGSDEDVEGIGNKLNVYREENTEVVKTLLLIDLLRDALDDLQDEVETVNEIITDIMVNEYAKYRKQNRKGV